MENCVVCFSPLIGNSLPWLYIDEPEAVWGRLPDSLWDPVAFIWTSLIGGVGAWIVGAINSWNFWRNSYHWQQLLSPGSQGEPSSSITCRTCTKKATSVHAVKQHSLSKQGMNAYFIPFPQFPMTTPPKILRMSNQLGKGTTGDKSF